MRCEKFSSNEKKFGVCEYIQNGRSDEKHLRVRSGVLQTQEK